MLRRPLPPEPVAVSADWCRTTAAFAAVLATIGVAIARGGLLDGLAGVAVVGAALLCAFGALLLAARAAVVIWRTGRRGVPRVLAGCLLGALVLAYPATLAVLASRLPAISDVSTDPGSPPAFSVSKTATAARAGAAHPEPSSETRDAQRRAYPDIGPAMLDVGPEDAFKLALQLVAARRWRVVEATPPHGRLGTGHIDAVAASTVLKLPEDVTIRIRPEASQTRVDMRSASRLERHDIGSNAARIESFIEDLENAE